MVLQQTTSNTIAEIEITEYQQYWLDHIRAADTGEDALVEIAIELRASARSQFIPYLSQQDGNNKDQQRCRKLQ
jgi:hypothetical protein